MSLHDPWGLGWTSEEADARKISNALKTNDGVKMECFNRDEAQGIWVLLSDSERQRTSMTWLFGPSDRLKPKRT